MPKVSYAELFDDWDTLLANAREHTVGLPSLGPVLDRLQSLRQRIAELQTQRRNLQAESLLLSREIEALREEGKERAIEARCFLKSKFGARGEELVAFRIKPRRKYKKRKAPAPEARSPERSA